MSSSILFLLFFSVTARVAKDDGNVAVAVDNGNGKAACSEARSSLRNKFRDVFGVQAYESDGFIGSTLTTLYGAAAYGDKCAPVLAGSDRTSASDAASFDLVIDITSMSDLRESGWMVERGAGCGGNASRAPCLFRGLVVSVVGHFSKGKTWFFDLLFGKAPETSEQLIATRGLSILQHRGSGGQHQQQFTLIDTAGRGPPIVETGIMAFADRAQLEDMMADVVASVSDSFIYVVNDLTWEEQREIFQIVTQLQRQGTPATLFVVHNLKDWKVDTYHRYVFLQLKQRYPHALVGSFVVDTVKYFYLEQMYESEPTCVGYHGECVSVVVRHFFTVHHDDKGTIYDRCVDPECVPAADGVNVRSNLNRKCVKVECASTDRVTAPTLNNALGDYLRNWFSMEPTLQLQRQTTDVLALVLARINLALKRLSGDVDGVADVIPLESTEAADPGSCDGDSECGSVVDTTAALVAKCPRGTDVALCGDAAHRHWRHRMLHASDADGVQKLVKTFNWTVANEGVALVTPFSGAYDPREVFFVPKQKYAPRIVQLTVPRATDPTRFHVRSLGGTLGGSTLFEVTGFVHEPVVAGSAHCGTDECRSNGIEMVTSWARFESHRVRYGTFKRLFRVSVLSPDLRVIPCTLADGILEIAIFPQAVDDGSGQEWEFRVPDAYNSVMHNCAKKLAPSTTPPQSE